MLKTDPHQFHVPIIFSLISLRKDWMKLFSPLKVFHDKEKSLPFCVMLNWALKTQLTVTLRKFTQQNYLQVCLILERGMGMDGSHQSLKHVREKFWKRISAVSQKIYFEKLIYKSLLENYFGCNDGASREKRKENCWGIVRKFW